MIPMKTLTIKGKTYEIVDEQARSSIVEQRESIRRTCSTAIVQTVEGSPIVVNDSSDNQLLGLKLFGKITQNEVTDVYTAQELKHIGSSGSIEVCVESLNLINTKSFVPYSNKSIEVSDDGYAITVTGGANNPYTSSVLSLTHLVEVVRGKKVYFAHDSMYCTVVGSKCGPQINLKRSTHTDYLPLSTGTPKLEVDIPDDIVDITIGVYTNNTDTALAEDNTVIVEGLRLSLIDNDWVESSATSITIPTPNGLPGLPVSSSGNYIDETGKHWLCDEIDFERGLYIQRVRAIDNTELNVAWNKSVGDSDNNYMYHVTIDDQYPVGYGECLCNRLVRKTTNELQADGNLIANVGITASPKYNVIYVNIGAYLLENSPSAMKAFFEEYPLTVVYGLAKPIVTQLSAAQIESYKTLYTVYPGSTIMNNSNAFMEVKYNADTKLYIQNLIQEVIDHG